MRDRKAGLDTASGTPADVRARPLIAGVALITFPAYRDQRGVLVAFDHLQGLPFALRRVFYVLDVPSGAERAGHAVSADCVCLAAQGALDLHFANGREQGSARLDDPTVGLHVKGGILLRASDFAPGSVMVVLASEHFADVRYESHPFFYGDESGQ